MVPTINVQVQSNNPVNYLDGVGDLYRLLANWFLFFFYIEFAVIISDALADIQILNYKSALGPWGCDPFSLYSTSIQGPLSE